MRSLYTDDISGSRSRTTIFQKNVFKEKYDKFVKSNQKNPQHKKYQWYVSPKKQRNDPSDNRQPRYTLKLMSQHTGHPRSGHFQYFKSVNQIQQNKNKNFNSSVLLNTGKTSVSQIIDKKGLDNNPYFPHRYQDYNQSRIKWSGNRNWNYQKMELPNITKSKLISYI